MKITHFNPAKFLLLKYVMILFDFDSSVLQEYGRTCIPDVEQLSQQLKYINTGKGTGKVVPVPAMKAHTENGCIVPLTSPNTKTEVNGRPHNLATLSPGKEPQVPLEYVNR
jgi:hypothetical protein